MNGFKWHIHSDIKQHYHLDPGRAPDSTKLPTNTKSHCLAAQEEQSPTKAYAMEDKER